MQKIIFSVALILVFIGAEAQTKIGLKFSPLLTTSRTNLMYDDLATDTLDVDNDGGKGKFSLGLVIDHSFSDTYRFSTGLTFLPKTVGISISGENGGQYPNPTEAYNLQYIQLPISLKLFTNEVLPDMSIFFQVGGNAEVKIFEQPVEEEYLFVEEFSPLDLSAMLSAGVEFNAGLNTVLFFDVSYQRGLLNVVKSTTPNVPEDFTIRTTSVLLDLGIKF